MPHIVLPFPMTLSSLCFYICLLPVVVYTPRADFCTLQRKKTCSPQRAKLSRQVSFARLQHECQSKCHTHEHRGEQCARSAVVVVASCTHTQTSKEEKDEIELARR